MRIRKGITKRVIVGMAGLGILTQVAGCPTNLAQLQQQIQPITDLAIRQIANLAADTAFFILDNFLVRLTG